MKNGTLALLFLTVTLSLPVTAQTAAAHNGLPALKFRAQEFGHPVSFFVEYLQYGGEPAFRIRAHHYHAWCNGYFYVTPTSVVYDPSLTPAQKDGIAVRRRDLLSFHPRFSGYEFAVPGKDYKIAYLSDPDLPTETPENQRPEMREFIALARNDFAAAQNEFFAILTGQQSSTGLNFDSKPIIKILEPPGTTPNATVDGTAEPQFVMGIAASSSGVSTVSVNDKPAELKPLSKEIVFFQTGRSTLPDGISNVVAEAATADGNRNSVAFQLIRPQVRIVAPAPGSTTRDEKVTVQGTVLGMRDLVQAELAGKSLPLTKRTDGGFDFHSAGIPLEMGTNLITGFVVRANGQRPTFDFSVVRLPPVPRLTLQAIERALKGSVSPVRIEALVDDQGVDFDLTPELEKRLQADGATKSLLDAIAEASPTGGR